MVWNREKKQTLGDFHCGKCPVFVATSVAARGLDIENVWYVISFDDVFIESSVLVIVETLAEIFPILMLRLPYSTASNESTTRCSTGCSAQLEESALSTCVPGFRDRIRGNVFASDDPEKNHQGKSTLNTARFSFSQAPNPVDDESWD